MTMHRPTAPVPDDDHDGGNTTPDAFARRSGGAPGTPLYRRLARKEARLREDQYVGLSRLVRVLARRRTNRSGPRLTENTLIRVAIDLLLSRANRLTGDTENELRTSILDPPRPTATPSSQPTSKTDLS